MIKIGMIPEAREVRLRPKIRKVLEARCRAPRTPQGDLKRAQIVLLAAEGRSTRSIAKEVGVQPRIVSKWRHRFADHGLAGLNDRPLASKKPIYSQATNRRILALLDKPPPGYARWTGPLLAMPLQDVDVQYFCASTTSIEAGRLRDPTPSLSLTARPSLLVAGTANANA